MISLNLIKHEIEYHKEQLLESNVTDANIETLKLELLLDDVIQLTQSGERNRPLIYLDLFNDQLSKIIELQNPTMIIEPSNRSYEIKR